MDSLTYMSAAYPIVLVTPVWNDSARLEAFGFTLAEALNQSGMPVRWILSDDGSCAVEKQRLEALASRLSKVYPQMELIYSELRSRKGGAIYRAWDAHEEAEILAFVDADGAVSAESIVSLLRVYNKTSGDCAVVAVRQAGAGLAVQRSFSRALSFRIFRGITRYLLGLRFLDTQCGAKVLSATVYREMRGQLLERGFIFDLELLVALRSRSIRIHEQPISWQEVSGGKVSLLRDSWSMLFGLLRIRRRLRKGAYSKSSNSD